MSLDCGALGCGWDFTAGVDMGYGFQVGPPGPAYPHGLWTIVTPPPAAPPPAAPAPAPPPPVVAQPPPVVVPPPLVVQPPPVVVQPPPPIPLPQPPPAVTPPVAVQPPPTPSLPPPGPATPPPPTIYEDAARQARADSRVRQLGRPVIPGETVVPPSAVWGVLGRVLGGLSGILWPTPVAPGTPSPAEVEDMIRREQLERARGDEFEISTRELSRIGPVSIPAPPAPRVELPPARVPTAPTIPLPAPPAPTPRAQPRAQTQTPPSPVTPPWALIGTILGSQILPRSRGRTRTTPRSQLVTPPSLPIPATPFSPPLTLTPPLTATPTPIPTPMAPPLTSIQTQVVSSAPPNIRTRTRQRECDCEPKRKRQKKRECRARAPVRWAGGPKKGQLAGSRCISWRDLR